MFQVLQRGKNLNSVYSLLDKVVVKKYISKNQTNREIEGIEAWSQICSNVPKKYLKFWKIVFYEKISCQTKLNKKQKYLALKNLANIYAQLINKYKYHKIPSHESYYSWENYLENNFDNYFNNKKIFQTFLNNQEISLIENILDELKRIDWAGFAKIPLHRDLHWGNLLMDEGTIRVIDFEHFCVGPIEYEFSNSIFWNDESSINFKEIWKILASEEISINKKLAYKLVVGYFIEQILLSTNDLEKTVLLVKKFKTFNQKYLGSLQFSFEDYTQTIISDTRNQLIESQTFLDPVSI